ncbi:MAG: alpha/beta hydrolase [Chromatiaceae bacterium]|nr:alpha/beta hydrolase [Chromatiaceae bacterium]MCF8003442.1 alpha/beta hydrolase [Chromatiaceae bacterium]
MKTLALLLSILLLPLMAQAQSIDEAAFKAALQQMESAPVQHVTVGDIDIAYKILGQGDPLFAITGNGDTMDLWSPLFIQGLAQERKVYLFDNRGAGLTTSGTKPFSIEQFAKDTAGFIRAMGYEKTDLLGFSMGSRIAAQLTIDQPALIKKVVLYGCAPGGPAEIKRSAAVQKIFADTSGTPEQKMQRMFSVLIPERWRKAHPDPSTYFPPVTETISPEVRAKQNAAVANWPGIDQQLLSIRTPTLILAGTDDEVVPPGNALTLARQIRASWLVRFRGGGHGMMYQFPTQMAKVVNTFLATAN